MTSDDLQHSHALRVDFFIHAAFAFTASLLVIASSDVPRCLHELLVAIRGIPAAAWAFSSAAGRLVAVRALRLADACSALSGFCLGAPA